MSANHILIIDEQRAGRVFSALASQSGYRSDWMKAEDLPRLDLGCYQLIVTSYPYGRSILELLAKKGRAVLVLADYACDDLVLTLAGQANCFYTVKPLNFSNFGTLVKNILDEKGDL